MIRRVSSLGVELTEDLEVPTGERELRDRSVGVAVGEFEARARGRQIAEGLPPCRDGDGLLVLV